MPPLPPAIDGVARDKHKTGSCASFAQRPVRSDVERLLNLSDADFNTWYEPRLQATNRQLEDYLLIGSIPHLDYGAEEQKLHLGDANTAFKNHIATLRSAQEYLGLIKEVRDQYKRGI